VALSKDIHKFIPAPLPKALRLKEIFDVFAAIVSEDVIDKKRIDVRQSSSYYTHDKNLS
jgi:hypothetical protein